jgi:mannose-6-phosphate isomerase-like protein (cupin superfamily)
LPPAPTTDLAEQPTDLGAIDPRIERLEAELIGLEQVECPLVHRFAPGVYLREITMPTGTFIIGQRHRTEHFNIVLRGRARVKMGDDSVVEIGPGMTFVSPAGCRKILYIIEEMVWQTIHPTKETNFEQLEAMLIEKSDTFKRHEIEAAQRELMP